MEATTTIGEGYPITPSYVYVDVVLDLTQAISEAMWSVLF